MFSSWAPFSKTFVEITVRPWFNRYLRNSINSVAIKCTNRFFSRQTPRMMKRTESLEMYGGDQMLIAFVARHRGSESFRR